MCQILPSSITGDVLRFYSFIGIIKFYIGYFNYYGIGIVEVGRNKLCPSDYIKIGVGRPMFKKSQHS